MKMINNQHFLGFNQDDKYSHQRVFLKPISNFKHWNSNGEFGYLSNIGGRIMVYREETQIESGYIIFNSEDELQKQFQVDY